MYDHTHTHTRTRTHTHTHTHTHWSRDGYFLFNPVPCSGWLRAAWRRLPHGAPLAAISRRPSRGHLTASLSRPSHGVTLAAILCGSGNKIFLSSHTSPILGKKLRAKPPYHILLTRFAYFIDFMIAYSTKSFTYVNFIAMTTTKSKVH